MDILLNHQPGNHVAVPKIVAQMVFLLQLNLLLCLYVSCLKDHHFRSNCEKLVSEASQRVCNFEYDRNGQMVKNGQHGQKWSKMDIMVKNGQKWTKWSKMDSKVKNESHLDQACRACHS